MAWITGEKPLTSNGIKRRIEVANGHSLTVRLEPLYEDTFQKHGCKLFTSKKDTKTFTIINGQDFLKV